MSIQKKSEWSVSSSFLLGIGVMLGILVFVDCCCTAENILWSESADRFLKNKFDIWNIQNSLLFYYCASLTYYTVGCKSVGMTCGKTGNLLSPEKYFVKAGYIYSARNFCGKMVWVNFRNFHHCAIYTLELNVCTSIRTVCAQKSFLQKVKFNYLPKLYASLLST